MIRAGAGLWQTQGHVDRIIEIQQLERNEPLIVIHGDDRVEMSARGIAENGVRHGRTTENRGTGSIETRDGGYNDPAFLIAEGSVLSSVRIQTRHRNARNGQATAGEKIRREQTDAGDALHREKCRHSGQGLVDGGQADSQRVACEQHAEILHSEGVGKVFSLTGKRKANRLQTILADRPGNDRVHSAVLQFRHRLVERGERGRGRARVRFAGCASTAVADDMDLMTIRDSPRGQYEVHDFRSDSGGVSQSDGDAGHGSDYPEAGMICQAANPTGKCPWRPQGCCLISGPSVKSRGVQRSVRTQRFNRSAGDAPSLGRVTRVHGTGLPKDALRRRRRSGGPRTTKEGMPGSPHRKKVIIAWTSVLVAGVLGILAVFFWSWLRPRMNSKSVADTAGESAVAMKRHNISAFESPSEEAALELVKQALELRDPSMVEKYFRPGSAGASGVIAFLSGMEELDGTVAGFQWLSSMDSNGLLIDGVLVSTVKEGTPRNRLALLTPDEAGVWKIDFDAFARTVTPSWDALLANDGGRGLVRVIVAKDSYYNGPFRDESAWVSYGMASPDAGAILLGYCRKDSPQARAMERIIAAEQDEDSRRLNRATLEVRRPDGAESRQFEITRVLAEDWVMGAEPFDTAFQ